MTERWRKKLEGIDQVGPSDDVYERAKDGPTLPEPQSPMQRTSTRVVTAIAAFVVFALAISLFAIPALRLGGNDRFVSAGSQIQPLWPWDSTDAVQAWRDDPQPIGTVSVDHFSSPDEVATAFGRDVLGWGEVWAHEEEAPQAHPCAQVLPLGAGGSLPPTAPGDSLSVVNPSGSMPPTGAAPYAPTTTTPAFRTFDVSTCPPSSVCDYVSSPSPDVKVVVYQPLGDGGPWAVLEAKTDLMSISLAPGTVLQDGSTVYASGVIPRGAQAVLGFHAASDGCGETGSLTGFEETRSAQESIVEGTYSRGQLQIGLLPMDASCQHRSGYVFVAITQKDLGTGDPVRGIGGDVGVVGFAAVPVSFDFPPTGASSGPPTGPTSTQDEWTTYIDRAGWTIDVPIPWVAQRIEGSDAKGTYEGAAFGSASLDQYPDGPTTIGAPPGEVALILYRGTCTACLGPGPKPPSDDTQFPLDIANMDPVDGGFLLSFQANGIPFTLAIRVGGGAPTPEQQQILDRMVSSIRFQPWTPGETQDGWVALHPTTEDDPKQQDAKISWQRCDQKGCYVLVYGDYGPGGNGPYVLGPVQPCGEGENMTADPASIFRIVLGCPDGSTQAWGAPGEPSANNSPSYAHALNVYPVIHAWDGTLLTSVTAG